MNRLIAMFLARAPVISASAASNRSQDGAACFCHMPTNRITLLTPVCLWLATGIAFTAEAGQRPNILFAIADDWSYGHAGAYGCPWVKTPAFDRVANAGILFVNAYTPTGKCSPSRASILTGRNPWQLKAAANHAPAFPSEFKTFPEALGGLGYFVGMTGKGWSPGNAGRRQLAGQPFDERSLRSPTKQISGNDYAGNFAAFLDAAPQGQPWCFWYGGHEPHRGYEYGSGVAKGGKKLGDIDRVPGCWPDNERVRHDMLDYAFEIEHFDGHLGRMLELLEKRGLLANTLVMVRAAGSWAARSVGGGASCRTSFRRRRRHGRGTRGSEKTPSGEGNPLQQAPGKLC